MKDESQHHPAQDFCIFTILKVSFWFEKFSLISTKPHSQRREHSQILMEVSYLKDQGLIWYIKSHVSNEKQLFVSMRPVVVNPFSPSEIPKAWAIQKSLVHRCVSLLVVDTLGKTFKMKHFDYMLNMRAVKRYHLIITWFKFWYSY